MKIIALVLLLAGCTEIRDQDRVFPHERVNQCARCKMDCGFKAAQGASPEEGFKLCVREGCRWSCDDEGAGARVAP